MMEKAKDYFDREYDKKNIATVIHGADLKSLYALMEEYAEKQIKNNVVLADVSLRFKGKRLDNGECIEGWFTKKKVGNLIVPVIERYREWDTGDYIETFEVDGSTVVNAS